MMRTIDRVFLAILIPVIAVLWLFWFLDGHLPPTELLPKAPAAAPQQAPQSPPRIILQR